MYWVKLSEYKSYDEEQQLGGAFIIDPKGGSAPDRVFVVNVSGFPIDTALYKYGLPGSFDDQWQILAIYGKDHTIGRRYCPLEGYQ